MMKFTAFALLVAMVGVAEAGFRTMQYVTVKGTPSCKRMSGSGIKVVLWEDEPGRDDKLAEVATNRAGSFTIKGGKKEFTKIDPYILIHHSCNPTIKKGKTCTRISKFEVPQKYIYSEGQKELVYDMGAFSLDIEGKDDQKVCK